MYNFTICIIRNLRTHFEITTCDHTKMFSFINIYSIMELDNWIASCSVFQASDYPFDPNMDKVQSNL